MNPEITFTMIMTFNVHYEQILFVKFFQLN